MHDLAALIPLLAFLLLCAGVAFHARRAAKPEGFIAEYYLGSKSMGGFVLAMTTVSTYISISFFMGGPGQAWESGFSWVYMAACQVTAPILIFCLAGKKLALIGRKINAVTIVDVIRSRYASDTVAVFSALIIVLLFGAVLVAQFVGGAKLFEAVTGYSYGTGLLIFGGTVVLFTVIGGFRGVALTDALCGIAILLSTIIIAGGILMAGGGYTNIMEFISTTDPELLSTDAGGDIPLGLYLSQWLLMGIFAFTLPQSALRTMGARDSKSLRTAMIIGTLMMGLLVLGTTAIGVLTRGVVPTAFFGIESLEDIVPLAMLLSLPSWLLGLCVIGPIAAAVSTVSSLLITSSSSIMKDIYLRRCENRGTPVPQAHVIVASQALTFVLGIGAIVVAIFPPDLVWWIDVFVFGGLESAFTWVIVMGLFWKRANKYGAFASMVGGTMAYCLSSIFGASFMSAEQIMLGLAVSLACMVVVSLTTSQPNNPDLERVFFPND